MVFIRSNPGACPPRCGQNHIDFPGLQSQRSCLAICQTDSHARARKLIAFKAPMGGQCGPSR